MRVVLDTNVLVSGLQNPEVPPGQLLRAWAHGRFKLVTSEAQLTELRRTLRYPKLRKRIPKHVAGALINAIKARATFVEPTFPPFKLPDEDDLAILGTALAAQADWLVTGDRTHLLAVRKYGGTVILNPTEAVRRMRRFHGR